MKSSAELQLSTGLAQLNPSVFATMQRKEAYIQSKLVQQRNQRMWIEMTHQKTRRREELRFAEQIKKQLLLTW